MNSNVHIKTNIMIIFVSSKKILVSVVYWHKSTELLPFWPKNFNIAFY